MRTRTDGGNDISIVDQRCDVLRAGAGELKGHAGWAGDCQAGCLLEFWCRVPEPARTLDGHSSHEPNGFTEANAGANSQVRKSCKQLLGISAAMAPQLSAST